MGKNVLEFFQGSEIDGAAKERVLIYGRAGVGKTRFALSIPEAWGRIAYYAADNNSWLLRSISKTKRDRISVIRPKGDNPPAQIQQLCMMDLDEAGPDIGVIVIDTYTKVALDSLKFIANTNCIAREQHYYVGEVGEGGVAVPTRSDLQGLDAQTKSYLDDLFAAHPDKHIIFIMHEESKQVGGKDGPIIGGPQHPGWTMIDYLPSQFSTIVRLIRDDILLPDASDVGPVVVAVTEYDGKFPAKLRTNDEEAPNPLARKVLDRNPSPWWLEYEAYCQGQVGVSEKPKKKRKSA